MKLRVVPTKAHAAVDHVVGPALVVAPELFRLKASRAEPLVPRATGTLQAIYSNLTDYELAAKRLLPLKAHLALDGASGAALGASPWLLGTARRGVRHWLPHALVGALEVGLALTTKTEPGDRRRPDYRLRKAVRVATWPGTWKVAARGAKTVASTPALRKASRKVAAMRLG